LRPLRGDRLTLLVLTEVEDDWKAIILFPLREHGVGRETSGDENGVVSHSPPPQEAHPMERLLELLGPVVEFVYTCWDRVVLNG